MKSNQKPIHGRNAGSLFLAMIAAAAVLFSGCDGDKNDGKIAVTGVIISKTTLKLVVGHSEILTAAVAPEDADNPNVTWSSNDSGVASVDASTGEVTGVSVGTAVITVTTQDGGRKDNCTVTVGNFVHVSSVGITRDALVFEEVGASETLVAVVAPGNATNQAVTWSSSSDEIATVDQTGLVTAVATGKATITVTTDDGGLTAECKVTIAVPVTSVGLNKNSLTLEVVKGEILVATVMPANATNKGVIWSSDKPKIASVHPSSGEVTALSAGEAAITATTRDGSKTDVCTVTVTDTVDPAAPTYNNVTGIVMDVADPYVLQYGGKYYIYGTGNNSSRGIKVYESTDLVNWSGPVGKTDRTTTDKGYALYRDHVWGTANFWAPEVYYLNDKFYMFFSVAERISVATSDSPLGPFSQSTEEQKVFHDNIWEIDTHLFIDDDGKKYLYFVRKPNGNYIYVAELSDDMRSIKESTMQLCINPSQPWEYHREATNEGPFVLKYRGYYYLTYSGSHYETDYYGVGYATSTSPLGPWTKSSTNPILQGDFTNLTGVGHHSFVYSPSGALYMVFHAHYTKGTVQPRKAGLDRAIFDNSTIPATLIIQGPTITDQKLR